MRNGRRISGRADGRRSRGAGRAVAQVACLAFVFAALAPQLGCSKQGSSGRGVQQSPREAGPIRAPDPGCDAVKPGRVAARTDPLPPACLEPGDPGLTHSGTPELYDDCVPVSWSPGACPPPPLGDNHTCEVGHWTTLCADDSDCPSGSRCTAGDIVGTIPSYEDWGDCEQSCDPKVPTSCVRCDMACNPKTLTCRYIGGPGVDAGRDPPFEAGP